ncbi:MAG: hypothetical protein WCP35_04410 [Verrucomicrobiota bacterium]
MKTRFFYPFILAAVVAPQVAAASEYYVAAQGSDNDPGTNVGAAAVFTPMITVDSRGVRTEHVAVNIRRREDKLLGSYLDSDIGDAHNVAAERHDVIARLQKRIDAIDADLGVKQQGPGVRPPGRFKEPTGLYLTEKE